MGKVLDTFPGSDSLVSVVKNKTTRGEITRPIAMLAVQPFSEMAYERELGC